MEVGTLGLFLGIIGVGFAALGLFLLFRGSLVGRVGLLLAAFDFATIPLSIGGTLWADAE